jgi:hypothetical protein
VTKDWEQIFSGWTGAEGTVEESKAKQTLARVTDALKKSEALSLINLSVYPKGSYPNRTNVVQDSDIDVSVEATSFQHHEMIHKAEGLTIQDFGLTPYTGPYHWQSLKDHVEQALVAEFGAAGVERGNKAILVKATSSTLPADVVACATTVVHTSRTASHRGVQITPDTGPVIVNYPKQHLDEGLAKNSATSKRYKRSVRILKRLENEMVKNHVITTVPSFLIESLVWNCEKTTFAGQTTWTDIIRAVIVEAYKHTETDAAGEDLTEANGIKYLFHPSQKWTRGQANEFLVSAYNYVGYS